MMAPLEARLLSWIVFLPILTALGLLAFRIVATSIVGSSGVPGWVWRAIALASSTLTFALAVVGLWGGFDPEVVGYQWIERVPWIPELGIHYFVGVDGISLVLVLLTTFVVPIVLLGSWTEVERPLRSYSILLLLLESGVNGALVSLNWIQLYFFWELTLLSSFFIMGRWGGVMGLRTATKHLIFGLSSSFLMLIVTLIVYRMNLEQGGVGSFDLVLPGDLEGLAFLDTVLPLAAAGSAPWWQTQDILFTAFALAIAIKLPLIPLHGWYNDAQGEAPTAGSAIVSSLVLKLGAFALLRIALPLFPDAASEAAPLMCAIAVFGVIASGLLCLAQRDAKLLVGFVSLAHMSFIVLGIFSLQHHAVVGSVVHMLSHGLSIAALFILFGFLVERRQTRGLEEYGGLAKPMPLCAALFAIVLLGQVGIPGTSGFVGTFLIFLGSFPSGVFVTTAALAGMLLVGGALLVAVGRVMLGPLERPENRGLIDFDWRERVVVMLLVIPILWIGVYPNAILRRVEPSVSLLLHEMDLSKRAPTQALSESATEVSFFVGSRSEGGRR
ncbi:MAG: NADH-quinone oxidoreductase subunit M [bacterium]|nr:NADH-quinone oxidoreductase subunit M [bacterium]